MMVISWHDRVARPARVRVLERFIAYAQKRKGVWFARKDEIARWALAEPADDPRDGGNLTRMTSVRSWRVDSLTLRDFDPGKVIRYGKQSEREEL